MKARWTLKDIADVLSSQNGLQVSYEWVRQQLDKVRYSLETDFGVLNRTAMGGSNHQTIAQMRRLFTYQFQLRKINKKCPRKIPTLFF